MTELYLTTSEVAKRLRLSRQQVAGLCKSGQLAHLKVGRTIRITEIALQSYLLSNTRVEDVAADTPAPKRAARGKRKGKGE